MVTYICEKCRAALERRTAHFGSSSADRLHCPRCNADYTLQQLCDVCHLGRVQTPLNSIVHRSSILGEHQIRHCPSCRPPSKASLEFAAAPGTALLKYGLMYGVPALCLLLMLASILSGSR